MKMELPQEQKRVIEELLSKVKDMTPEAYVNMLKEMSKFHRYSMFNQILIYSKGASQVAGYKQWQEKHKRNVVEKSRHKIGAIQILAPKIGYFISTDGQDYHSTTQKKFKDWRGEKKSFPTGFFGVTVFDISDTEGEPVAEVMTPKSQVDLETVLEAAHRLGFQVERKPLSLELGGCIVDKMITLNSNRQESGNVGTLIHELAHGLLGHTDTSCEHETSVKEVQAETVTYLVCQQLGIERNSIFYLKSWGMSENILNDFSQLSKVSEKIIKEIKGGEHE